VDLVEEQDRSLPVLAKALAGTLDHLSNVLDPGGDRRERLKRLTRCSSEEGSERRLPGPWWTPEDDGGQTIPLCKDAKGSSLTYEVLLAHHLVKG